MEKSLQHEIADQLIDLFWEWNLEENKFRWSASRKSFLGYDVRLTRITEEWWTSRLHPDYSDTVVSGLLSAVEGDELTWCDDFLFLKSGGGFSFLRVTSQFCLNEQGQKLSLRGVVIILGDTPLVVPSLSTNKEIEDYRLFMMMACHDLGSPINTIDAYSRLLFRNIVSEGLGSDEQEYMGAIEGGLARLKLLMRGIEHFNNSNNSNFYVPRLEPIHFEALVKEVCTFLKHRLFNSDALVKYDGVEAVIMADKYLVTLILQNLVENALKYNHSVHPTITIHLRISGTDVVFSVTDNGMGISERYQKLIFEPFHRIHPNKGAKGSGLGLYAARRAAEKMNGSIRCYSEMGVGSTFEVRLFEQRAFREENLRKGASVVVMREKE